MKIVIGADHGGFILKNILKDQLQKNGHEVIDKGTFSTLSIDYPEIAKDVGEEVVKQDCLGILICKTGTGMCIAANKVKNVRAALLTTQKMTKMARKHNNINVLCLGAEIITPTKALRLVNLFLNTAFDNETRHIRRLNQITKIENNPHF